MSSSAAVHKNSHSLIFVGIILLLSGTGLLLTIFFPVLTQEVTYQLRSVSPTLPQLTPVDTQFGIVIPKIGANAKIIANVDPYNSREYQTQLTRGVAHAQGTAFPGQVGNVFLFAHSSDNWYTANRYNSVFYLIHQLEKGDAIDLYYQDRKYSYHVVDKKTVDPQSVAYLQNSTSQKQVTLMTCWPPGTTLKRLLVIAQVD